MTTERARKTRGNPTAPEQRLWGLLQSLKPLGFHFRRQVPIGKYYADFACHHARLIIEVDGDTHGTDSTIAYDSIRDQFLRNAGYDVVRVPNDEVVHNLDGVGRLIEETLKGRTTLPTPTRLPPPSPQGGGTIAANAEQTVPSSPSPLRGGTARSAKGGGRAGFTAGPGQHAFRKDHP